jgi:hypothetical protein
MSSEILSNPARAHQPGSVDPPKTANVSLAAVAERAQSLHHGTTTSFMNTTAPLFCSTNAWLFFL